MSHTIVQKVIEQLNTMPESLQKEVLAYTQQLKLSAVIGAPGKNLLQFAGAIPADDLEIIRQAVEVDCEQVDLNEW